MKSPAEELAARLGADMPATTPEGEMAGDYFEKLASACDFAAATLAGEAHDPEIEKVAAVSPEAAARSILGRLTEVGSAVDAREQAATEQLLAKVANLTQPVEPETADLSAMLDEPTDSSAQFDTSTADEVVEDEQPTDDSSLAALINKGLQATETDDDQDVSGDTPAKTDEVRSAEAAELPQPGNAKERLLARMRASMQGSK